MVQLQLLLTKLIPSKIWTSPIVEEPGYAKKQLSLFMLKAQSPWGLGGVSLIVWSTFISLILWMYKLSSRQTTSRALKQHTLYSNIMC